MVGIIQGEQPIAKPAPRRDNDDPMPTIAAAALRLTGVAVPWLQQQMVGHDMRRDHPNNQESSRADDDDVIQITQNRNEIRNQIDGRYGVTRDGHSQQVLPTRVVRGSATSKVERVDVALEVQGPGSQKTCHRRSGTRKPSSRVRTCLV